MNLIRWTLWNLGVRVCHVIGRPIDALIDRMPERVQENVGACIFLHPYWLLNFKVPESWWNRAGWNK